MKRNEMKSGEDLMVMINGKAKGAQVMIQAAKKAKDAKTTVLLHWIKK